MRPWILAALAALALPPAGGAQEIDIGVQATLTADSTVDRGYTVTVVQAGLHHTVQPVASIHYLETGDGADLFLGVGLRLAAGALFAEWTAGRENIHHDDGNWAGVMTGGLLLGPLGIRGSWYRAFGSDDVPQRGAVGVFVRLK